MKILPKFWYKNMSCKDKGEGGPIFNSSLVHSVVTALNHRSVLEAQGLIAETSREGYGTRKDPPLLKNVL